MYFRIDTILYYYKDMYHSWFYELKIRPTEYVQCTSDLQLIAHATDYT